ncbi:DEAD/DEAH box helicase [Arachidicoccus soli]|uniref:DEAD-box ATP-dependent RNA helicase RhpA n=1 Tax=Arachidicoccus soli TaxID=2341117 RepID=A0A386HMP7_9BACT|nr:DEAD/DEAH box helicase [Arachidicoccus soli]AYD46614.1 DEAD/DEAH box helicase [Arachidicoccus soli]
MAFKNLSIIDPILKALEAEGYSSPTPIQSQAIPLVLERKDVLGCAQTGTGKTAAFAIPILQILYTAKRAVQGIKVLILTPTRELAIQIDESFASYGRYTGISHTVIFGGVSQLHQTNKLKNGVDVLIATPGRLLDLMGQGFINLKHLEIFVLDEADRMLDMGFIHDVKKVILKLPANRQTLFFSATMPPEIQKLADALLSNPAQVAVTPPSSTVDKIEQSLYYTNKADKPKLLLHLLKKYSIETALVFARTKHGADKVVKILHQANIKAAAIHGNKSQNNRQNALKGFKSGEINVLVATDIAARGIDIDDLKYVFNYDLPNVRETYVHRIGRTGRAGNAGTAISFCDLEERTELKDIQKLISKNIPVMEDHPYPIAAGTLAQKILPKQAQTSFKKQRPNNNNNRGGKPSNRNTKLAR